GAELKNTFCLTRDRYAFVSHHIGDLENYETLRSFEEGVAHYEKLFRIHPDIIAADLHPDYLATRSARERADRESLPFISVQHHHAHLAACLADNGWDTLDPVIGLSFDGTGMGLDGAIWGSEVLLGGYAGFTRKAHLRYVPLAGGDASVRKPSRMALAHLWAAGLDWEADLPPVSALCAEERTALRLQLERGFNALPTSSMGRLFDAASALLGVRAVATYEGQAAVELEACLDPDERGWYPLEIRGEEIDPSPLWSALLADWRAGVSVSICAARFHNSITAVTLEICQQLRNETSINSVALSGGVWQNRSLYTHTLKTLQNAKFNVLVHHRLPANDGCISLGQAVVAAAQSGYWKN
ncbi:MAG: carbamoyltransferase HypF, partial [Anaerolineaceae bacterium]